MSYAVKYRLEFDDINGISNRVDILQKDFAGGITILEGSGTPALLTSINNNEEKFNPLRGQKLTIQILVNGNFSIEDILSEDDDTFKVELYRRDILVWTGFVVQDDCSEEYQDPPYIVTIEAVDNLALLESIPLTDVDGSKFDGRIALFDLIKACLFKTNLDLDIYIIHNLYYYGSEESNNALTQVLVDARTFKSDDATFINCAEVLTKILEAFGCVLTQIHGKWFIYRLKELQQSSYKIWKFDYDGNELGTETDSWVGEIGGELIDALNVDQLKSIVRPYKSVELFFNYRYPKPIAANINLRQGELVLPASSPPDLLAYTVPRWTKILQNGTPTDEPLIYNTYVAYNAVGKEENRYLSLRLVSGVSVHLRHEGVPVKAGDKAIASFEYRTKVADSGNAEYNFSAFVKFESSDGGTKLFLRKDDEGNLYWGATAQFLCNVLYENDSTIWRSFSEEVPPFPEDGYVYLLFGALETTITGAPPDQAEWYRNINIEYLPINAGVGLQGHRWTVSQNKNYRNVFKKDVFLSDVSRKIFSGAMFKHDTDALIEAWYEAGSAETTYDLTERTALDIFNAYFRYLRKIEGSFSGIEWKEFIDSDSTPFFCLNLLQLFSVYGMEGRYFLPLFISSIDFRNLTFQAYLIEHKGGDIDLNGGHQGDARDFEYIYVSQG